MPADCPSLADYPLKKLTDARSAMARALSAYIGGLTFTLPKTTEPFKLAAVYPSWAQFFDRAISADGKLPAAAVLPDRLQVADPSLTPRIMEETWSGGEVCPGTLGNGTGDGFALFSVAEAVVPFVVVVRTAGEKQREAIVSGIEDAFVEDGSFLDPGVLPPVFLSRVEDREHPIRFGRLIQVPDYYDQKARFTLLAIQVTDSEQSARENRWTVLFEIGAQMTLCVPRRVRAMRPKVVLSVNEVVEER